MLMSLTIRIPDEDYAKLKFQSYQQGISISEIVRQKFSELEQFEKAEAAKKDSKDLAAKTSPFVLEILFLLREIVIERDSQILRRAQIQLDTALGEDRPKI